MLLKHSVSGDLLRELQTHTTYGLASG